MLQASQDSTSRLGNTNWVPGTASTYFFVYLTLACFSNVFILLKKGSHYVVLVALNIVFLGEKGPENTRDAGGNITLVWT